MICDSTNRILSGANFQSYLSYSSTCVSDYPAEGVRRNIAGGREIGGGVGGRMGHAGRQARGSRRARVLVKSDNSSSLTVL